MPTLPDLLDIPPQRRDALAAVAAYLTPGKTVVLSTHINSDGDGCGSEVATARILQAAGLRVRIVNPTPWPNGFRFLLGDDVMERSQEGAKGFRGADLLLVLDISDVSRLGVLADAVRALKVPRLVIDHHVAHDEPAGDVTASDIAACATGEMIRDLAHVMGVPITAEIAVPLYVAMLTDTGGFRFSNTSPRCHAIAAELLAAGVEPESIYRAVYQSMPVGRLHLLREALASVEQDPTVGLAWISLAAGALERHQVTPEDLDGLAEHPRSIAGTRLALFFRDLGHDRVKVSFRSTGAVDVNVLARQFGGGGHAKAAGALIPGALDAVQPRVIQAARDYLLTIPVG